MAKFSKIKWCDLSAWQEPETISYKELARHIDGFALRLTLGMAVDGAYREHFAGFMHGADELSRDEGRDIPAYRKYNSYGFYIYCKAVKINDTYSEIDRAIEVLSDFRRSNDYKVLPDFVALDIEGNCAHELEKQSDGGTAYILNAVQHLKNKLEGAGFTPTKAGLYASASRLNKWLEKTPALKQFFIWCAAYLTETAFETRYPTAYNNADMWQYTSAGRIMCAYGGDLDLNRRR